MHKMYTAKWAYWQCRVMAGMFFCNSLWITARVSILTFSFWIHSIILNNVRTVQGTPEKRNFQEESLLPIHVTVIIMTNAWTLFIVLPVEKVNIKPRTIWILGSCANHKTTPEVQPKYEMRWSTDPLKREETNLFFSQTGIQDFSHHTYEMTMVWFHQTSLKDNMYI
jgi:hypothetical protein